jgi:hypothetical protein
MAGEWAADREPTSRKMAFEAILNDISPTATATQHV